VDAQPERRDDAPEAPTDGVHRHDGFMLRLTLGPGAGVVGFDANGSENDTAYVGGGWASSLDIGFANGDNLTIFGRLREASLPSPAVYVNDDKVGDAESTVVTQGMLGAGISYFIMPLNMYLGAAVGLAVVSSSYQRPGGRERTYNGKLGFGMDLEIGKEWWVADDWGLGVAARLNFANVPGGESVPDDADFGAVFVAILFTATYQ
jgi:hypothetical protein